MSLLISFDGSQGYVKVKLFVIDIINECNNEYKMNVNH